MTHLPSVISASVLAGRLPCQNSLDATHFDQWAQAALSFAIIQGKVSTVQKLLCRHDIDINGQSPQALPPILTALEHQQHEILKILLRDPRLNINNQDDRGYTAIHLAVIYDDPVAMRIILDHKHIDVNYLDSAGRSAILLATMTYDGLDPKRNQIIDLLLLNRKTLVNERDQRGRSALWHAANTGNRRLILQLAQLSNLEPENSDDNGVSPLGQARKRGNIEIYALLQGLTARAGY